jgi:hypothetical protein
MILKYGPYSPSRLETAVCPYSFYKQYVGPEGPQQKHETLPQARGSVVHEMFEQITAHFTKLAPKQCEHPILMTGEEIEANLRAAINRHPAAFQDVMTIKAMIDLYIARPPRILTSDAKIELRMAMEHTGSGFEECDYNSPTALARGRADIMMVSDDLTTAIVYDHKTQPNIEDSDTFQLGFYSWVIMRTYPFLENVQTILHFARYGKYSEPYIWTKEDILGIEDEVMTRIGIIESKTSWDPVANKNCQYCPIAYRCPLLKEMFDVDDHGNYIPKGSMPLYPGDTSSAVKMAEELQVLEEATKIRKDALKTHVKNYGPIAIHGKRYDFSADEKVDWDRVNKYLRNPTYEVFQKHGIDEREHMGFSQTFSTGIWKLGKEELIKELDFPKKITMEFRGHKI